MRVLLFFFIFKYSLFAMTADMAANRCQTTIDTLEKEPLTDELERYKAIILSKIASIKGSKATDIPALLESCLRGVDAISWIIENQSSHHHDENPTITDQPNVKRTSQVNDNLTSTQSVTPSLEERNKPSSDQVPLKREISSG